jgi:chemotaxis protein MotB
VAKKKKSRKPADPPAGAPEWMVTFGDMMSLLLCFFVLLAAMSELKKEHEYQQVVDAIKEAFGYQGGTGVLPVTDPPVRSMLKKLEELIVDHNPRTKVSQTNAPGPTGQNQRVTRIREGLVFSLGGNNTFDRGSFTLNEPVKVDLDAIAKLAEGRNNKIVIRGHADASEILLQSEADSGWADLYDLGYRRAKAAMEYLVNNSGLRTDSFILDSRADTEPMRPRAHRVADQQVNRRVEVILTETLVDDFNLDADMTDPVNARGG